MHNGHLVDFVDPHENTLAQFIQRPHADMFEKSAGHLSEQCLNNLEPGAMYWCMHKFKSIGARGQIGAGFFGGVSGVVVKDDADYAIGGIVDIKIF